MQQKQNKLIQCPKWRNPVYENWEFCINCGTPICISKNTTTESNEINYDLPDIFKNIFKGTL